MAIRVRSMTDEEVEAVKQLAHSRTEPACKFERAG